MAKKIRFPLEMDDGVSVRSVEELRENFSVVKVIEYLKNGKLLTWLYDRYENDLAEKVEKLDENESMLAKNICEIFDVPYNEMNEQDLAYELERAERIGRLKQFTDSEKYIREIDNVAFDQDELYDLLDEGTKEIYLCDDRFVIPLSIKEITYRGVNNPVAVIDSKIEVDWSDKGINLESVRFDEKYQAVVDTANNAEEVLYVESSESEGTKFRSNVSIGMAPDKTYLSFMIPESENKSISRMYSLAKKTIGYLNYDADAGIIAMKKLVYDNDLIGLADRYISKL